MSALLDGVGSVVESIGSDGGVGNGTICWQFRTILASTEGVGSSGGCYQCWRVLTVVSQHSSRVLSAVEGIYSGASALQESIVSCGGYWQWCLSTAGEYCQWWRVVGSGP